MTSILDPRTATPYGVAGTGMPADGHRLAPTTVARVKTAGATGAPTLAWAACDQGTALSGRGRAVVIDPSTGGVRLDAPTTGFFGPRPSAWSPPT